jgi:hypothetical protein
MSKSLPARPNPEQLKKQAKELLKSHKCGEPDGLRRIQENHPDWGNSSAQELCAAQFSLGDAQLVIAREYGCASWPKLKAAVESIMATLDNPVVEKAKCVTWKTIIYERRFSKDGKRSWVRVAASRQTAYKPPGIYRMIYDDDSSQTHYVEISDAVHRRQLKWWPNKKKARLLESGQLPSQQLPYDPRGPFIWITEAIKRENLQWVETRATTTGEVNIFRHFIKDEFRCAVDIKERNTSWDVWIDQKTKHLVEFHQPGSDVFDPEKDPGYHNPPEKEWSYGEPAGYIDYDIVFDVELGDSLFLLEPPDGYVLDNWVPPPLPQIAEKDIIDYLAIAAEFNKKTFPDQVDFQFDNPKLVWLWFNVAKTVVEQKFVETQERFLKYGPGAPVHPFIKDNTEENSFRYLGKGIKLGDKNQIVCWYKLKGAASYRVVYGDLSVKDLAPAALPLPVEA